MPFTVCEVEMLTTAPSRPCARSATEAGPSAAIVGVTKDGTATAPTRSAAAPAMNVRRATRKRVLDVIEKPPGISERETRFDENVASRHVGQKLRHVCGYDHRQRINHPLSQGSRLVSQGSRLVSQGSRLVSQNRSRPPSSASHQPDDADPNGDRCKPRDPQTRSRASIALRWPTSWRGRESRHRPDLLSRGRGHGGEKILHRPLLAGAGCAAGAAGAVGGEARRRRPLLAVGIAEEAEELRIRRQHHCRPGVVHAVP